MLSKCSHQGSNKSPKTPLRTRQKFIVFTFVCTIYLHDSLPENVLSVTVRPAHREHSRVTIRLSCTSGVSARYIISVTKHRSTVVSLTFIQCRCDSFNLSLKWITPSQRPELPPQIIDFVFSSNNGRPPSNDLSYDLLPSNSL